MRSFSKFVIGAVVASACGYAAASQISATTRSIGLESLNNSAADADVNYGDVVLSVNDSFVSSDHLLISTNRTFGSVGLFPSAISCSVGTTANASVTFTRASDAASNATSIRYNVTSIGSASTSVGARCYSAESGNQTPANGNITLAFRATALGTAGAGNITVDVRRVRADGTSADVSSAGTIGSTGNEYTVSVAKSLDGVIDVQGGRLSFESGGAETAAPLSTSGLVDRFAVSVNRTSRTQYTSVLGSLSVTLTAGTSFGFLVDGTADGSCSIDAGSGRALATVSPVAGTTSALAHSAGGTSSGSCKTLTATFETIGDGGTFAIYLGRTAATPTSVNTAFADQSYTVAATTSTTARAVSVGSITSGTAAGSWTLNGTTVNIPYLPLTTSSVQVFVANRSAQSGEVTFSAWNASGTSCTGSLGTIEANANLTLGATLKAALLACTGTGWTGAARATVQLSMPTPSATTSVHTGFSATDSTIRATVVNDTNGK